MLQFSRFICGIALVTLIPTASATAQGVRLREPSAVYVDALGAGLNAPRGVAFNGDSRLVVSDTGNRRLLSYSMSEEGATAENEIRVPQLQAPGRVRFDSRGDLLVLDGRSRRIVRLDGAGAFKTEIVLTGSDGPIDAVITSFDVDRDGALYILAAGSGGVLVSDSGGRVGRVISIPPEADFISDIATATTGAVFAVDSVGRRVFVARRGDEAFSPLTDSMPEDMAFPTSIAADSLGHLFLADQGGSGIVVIGQNGEYQGRPVEKGWREGFLRSPADIFATDDYVFVADRSNNRVQRFTIAQ